ncbi:hypothetical protein K7X08_008678 [Anisodus acutangulus]|uniref:BHLH domain-containing protein n=1 Tax=Anisodus acutangulus TaxID=402998 RepID=A0A9Q1RSV7_9SOLA|nr:hypothetical protein K7X08_008678 [Anisodus acutangulus]
MAMVTMFITEWANNVRLWIVLPYHTVDIVSLVSVYVYKLVLVFSTGTKYLYLVREQKYWNDNGQLGVEMVKNLNTRVNQTKQSAQKSGTVRGSRAAEVHSLSERRRRNRINEKMKALQELLPHSTKIKHQCRMRLLNT